MKCQAQTHESKKCQRTTLTKYCWQHGGAKKRRSRSKSKKLKRSRSRKTKKTKRSRKKMTSPKIISFEWGKIVVEGYPNVFKDVKVFPGGARPWDWRETGTRHHPGIQFADVAELLEKGAEVIVLSRGCHNVLQTTAETLAELEKRKIEHYVLTSGDAVKKYNQLRKTKLVGALIHSTC